MRLSSSTYSGNWQGETAVSSIPVTCLPGPLQPVNRDKPALRKPQIRAALASESTMRWRVPIRREPSVTSLSVACSKNSTNSNASQGFASSSSSALASAKANWPRVWSRRILSTCSIAAGSRSNSATVACMASATESKKSTQSPRSSGSFKTFNSAETMPTKVPSLPQTRWFRLFGSCASLSSA